MKCPKCGMARPLTDQVCRRCRYVFDEDRFLDLAPPRVGSGAEAPRFFSRRSWKGLESLRTNRLLQAVASLIPGLGHLMQGKFWLGFGYFCAVVLLFGLSVGHFGQTMGQMLFGLAVSTHATCILDTTPWGRSPEAKPRILAMSAILTGLMALYWPLVVHLANTFVAPERRGADRGYRPLPVLGVDQLVIMIVLFALSVLVSTWLSRRLSSRET